MIRNILFLLLGILGGLNKVAGQQIPKIDNPCPDFMLNYVKHYSKKQVSLNDFKGTWLFMDFWFTGCRGCIRSFPKINVLQKEFAGKVQFLMIGYNSGNANKNIEEVYEKLKIKQGLNIAVAFDSTLVQKWNIKSMPHIIIIDPSGVVRSITDGRDITREKILTLLNDNIVSFYQNDFAQPDFDSKVKSNGESIFPKEKILTQSLLTAWNGEEKKLLILDEYDTYPVSIKGDGFKLTGAPLLEWLYPSAYWGRPSCILKDRKDPDYGKIYPYPILDLQSKVLFDYSSEDNETGLYNYFIAVPPGQRTKKQLMEYMQHDLKRAFGFNVFFEEREMPVWALTAETETEQKIKTKGGILYNSTKDGYGIATGFTLRNVKMEDCLKYLFYYLNDQERHPFIDFTGIKTNIDITIDADLTDIHDIKKALQMYGLDIVLRTKKMKVMIISEQK